MCRITRVGKVEGLSFANQSIIDETTIAKVDDNIIVEKIPR